MPDYKKIELIAIYMYINELYKMELQYVCQRFSNNSSPEFTDAELMTIYIFVMSDQKCFQIKDIHLFAKEFLRSWFPKLSSYQSFNNRLNRLSEAFKTLAMGLFTCYAPEDCDLSTSLTDSMPMVIERSRNIVTCKGKNRKAKVATEIVDKGWCSTTNMYYYGLKLHFLGYRRTGKDRTFESKIE